METINNSRTAVRDTKKAQLKKKGKRKKKRKERAEGVREQKCQMKLQGWKTLYRVKKTQSGL